MSTYWPYFPTFTSLLPFDAIGFIFRVEKLEWLPINWWSCMMIDSLGTIVTSAWQTHTDSHTATSPQQKLAALRHCIQAVKTDSNFFLADATKPRNTPCCTLMWLWLNQKVIETYALCSNNWCSVLAIWYYQIPQSNHDSTVVEPWYFEALKV